MKWEKRKPKRKPEVGDESTLHTIALWPITDPVSGTVYWFHSICVTQAYVCIPGQGWNVDVYKWVTTRVIDDRW